MALMGEKPKTGKELPSPRGLSVEQRQAHFEIRLSRGETRSTAAARLLQARS